MNYSISPTRDAECHVDALEDAAEAAEAAEIENAKNLKTDFMHFAMRDMKAPATFSKPYQAYGNLTGTEYLRHSTMGEIMFEALDLGDGPSTNDLMQFLSNEANTGNKAALALIERMAAKWAEVNAA